MVLLRNVSGYLCSAVSEMLIMSKNTDYLCKWCLTYVGQRRQFCSADCAAQFKICQRRREQRQDLNISVDYYGNVKLSIQGLHLVSNDDPDITVKPEISGRQTIASVRPSRRYRKRCRNCAKLLKEDEEDFCDDTCRQMDDDRTRKDDFSINTTQQRDDAERRRIRKWLIDAQDQFTKTHGPGTANIGDDLFSDGDLITSGPADLNPLPVVRTPVPNIRSPMFPENQYKRARPDGVSKSGSHRKNIHRPQITSDKFRIRRDEVVRGGPITLNPSPLRCSQTRIHRPVKETPINASINTTGYERHTKWHNPRASRPKYTELTTDSRRQQLMVDLNWIPKFYG